MLPDIDSFLLQKISVKKHELKDLLLVATFFTTVFTTVREFGICNFRCHVILANLRPPGQKGYVIPHGFLFEYITCPNYTMECVGWVLFTIATSTLPALFFGAAGTFQMAQWAIAKHARLRKVSNNPLQYWLASLHFLSPLVYTSWKSCAKITRPSQVLPYALLSAKWYWLVMRCCGLQTFDGKNGQAKYPRRWIMLPPFF